MQKPGLIASPGFTQTVQKNLITIPMEKQTKPKKKTRFRDAGTGEFVKKGYAVENPKTTVSEKEK